MKTPDKEVNTLVDHLFRTEYGRMVSYLTSKFGFHFLEDAQDVVQESLIAAFQNWSFNGIPESPEAWIFVTARNKAINILKRDLKRSSVEEIQLGINEASDPQVKMDLDKEIEDSMLRMIFVCCSTELSTENHIILILSTLCGFSRREIASALFAEEETIKKRLYRSKKNIREHNVSLNLPQGSLLRSKLNTVCSTLYLMFNEGYNSSNSKEVIRKDICTEAMRLTKLLLTQFPKETITHALFSLMCFHVARFESRIDDKGAIILFKDQDRTVWNKELINAGTYHLSMASKGSKISTYHIEAGIAMQHCISEDYGSTNWQLIYKLYEQLYNLKPSPIILLNLAIVRSKINGIDSAIRELERLKSQNKKLKNYYLLYASLGEFYHLKNDKQNANINFEIAKSLTHSTQEKQLLDRKMYYK